MPTATDALPAPIPSPGWTPAPVDARYVLSEDFARGAGGESLYLSEIAPGGAQAVAVRSVAFRDVESVVRSLAVADAAMRYHPAPGGSGAVLTITYGTGDEQGTTAVAVTSLTKRLAAFMEVDLKGVGPAVALAAAETLRQRVVASLAPALPGPLLERWLPLAMWAGAVLATYAAIAFSFARTQANIWLVHAGFLVFLGAALTSLAAGIRRAAAGRTEAGFGDGLLTLLAHPWVLSGPAAAAPVPLATLALLLQTNHDQPVLAVLYWGTIAAGLAVIALGSNHRLLRQLRRPARPGPEAVGDGWVTASTLPESFPALPEGRVEGMYAERGGTAAAVLVRPTRRRDPEWARWNHDMRTWAGPSGTVSGRAHQVWDQRVETIVEVTLGERVLLVESAADIERTWGLVRRLTDHLAERSAAPTTTARLRGFLTYSLAPVWTMYFLAAYFWLGIFAFRGAGLPHLTTFLVACIASLILTPILLITLNVLAAKRQDLFAITGASLLRRARRARLNGLLAALPLMLPIALLSSRAFPTDRSGQIFSLACVVWALASFSVSLVGRAHGSPGAYGVSTGRRRAR